MQYTSLGSTGTEVSELCFGTWRFGKTSNGTVETDREQAHHLLDAAWDAGINFIDTANVYGDPNGTSEEWIGDWLADHDRENFVLASKVYFDTEDAPNRGGLGRKHLRDQLEQSLDRLGTDYLDIYYIHRWDSSTPIRETVATLNDFVREGLVNHLGASMMQPWQLTKALWTSDTEGWERFEITQPRFNAAYRDAAKPGDTHVDTYVDLCQDQGLAVCPYSPLEGGFLTGKYDRDGSAPEGSRGDLREWEGFDHRQWAVLEAIQDVAEETDATAPQVALRWLIEREFDCVPIVGARTVEQLEENVGATRVTLTEAQLDRITNAY